MRARGLPVLTVSQRTSLARRKCLVAPPQGRSTATRVSERADERARDDTSFLRRSTRRHLRALRWHIEPRRHSCARVCKRGNRGGGLARKEVREAAAAMCRRNRPSSPSPVASRARGRERLRQHHRCSASLREAEGGVAGCTAPPLVASGRGPRARHGRAPLRATRECDVSEERARSSGKRLGFWEPTHHPF